MNLRKRVSGGGGSASSSSYSSSKASVVQRRKRGYGNKTTRRAEGEIVVPAVVRKVDRKSKHSAMQAISRIYTFTKRKGK